MRLDPQTLTLAQFGELIASLLAIDTLKSSTGRDDILTGIAADWTNDIARGTTARTDVVAIWTAASSRESLPAFLASIGIYEKSSPAFEALTALVDELTAFVEANADLYDHLGAFVAALSGAPRDTIAWWLTRVSSLVGEFSYAPAREPFRDLLLRLGEYRVDAAGESFPLFLFLDGVAGDVLDAAALGPFRGVLDQIAAGRKLTPAGIVRLRATVDGARRKPIAGGPAVMAVPGDPSILVVIEPDKDSTTPPQYAVRVYDWLPWESEEVARAMGSRGRAQNGSDPMPSRTRDALLSDAGRKELGAEIGRRVRQCPMEKPLVEFLVPAALIFDDFETVKIDVLGLGKAPLYQPLGTWSRVVVRPFDRWEPSFRQSAASPLAFWLARWRGLTGHLPRPLRSWWWKNGNVTALGLFRAEPVEVACFGLGFAPTAEQANDVYYALLAVGAPVALWTRVPVAGDVEAVLKTIVEATDPGDLRDRVQRERAKAHADEQTPHVGRSLTLVWDDPDRPPKPVT